MKTKSLNRQVCRILPAIIVCLYVAGATENVEAQVNAKRVLREASGKYSIVRSGGTATFDDGVNPSFTVTAPTIRGSLLIPVSSPRPTIRVTNSGLPGNGKAIYRGKRTNAKVNRAGSRIVYASRGTGDEDDGFGLYQGSIKGAFTKKGKRWRTALVKSGVQNQAGTMVKTVNGTRIRGAK